MQGNDDRNPKFCRLCWFELGTRLTLRTVVESCRVYYKSWTCKNMASFCWSVLLSHPNNKSRVE